MPTLDATVGGASANAYAEVSDADTYFDERLQAANWTGESSADVKERALIMATRRLDVLEYTGYRNATTQALKWPRSDAFDEDGEEYATDAIPAVIIEATYETALWLLNKTAESTDPLQNTGLEAFERAKVGPLDVTPRRSVRSGSLPDHVMRMLAHVRRSAGLVATMERG